MPGNSISAAIAGARPAESNQVKVAGIFGQLHEALVEYNDRLKTNRRLDPGQDHPCFFDDVAHLVV